MWKQCKPIEGPTPSIESLTSAFFGSCSNGCVFQYVDLHSQSIPPEAEVNVAMEIQIETQTAPLPMTRLVKDGCTSWKFSQSQVTTLEILTRGQRTSSTWRDQRIGRITASNMHAVLSKVLHIEKCSPKPLDCSSLVQKLCLKSDDLEHIAAIKYGRAMESEARQQYESSARKSGHTDLTVTECGMFVMPQKVYIGSSPDALVNCSCCGEGLLEIKWRISIAHVDPNAQPPPYIIRENGYNKLKKEHQYYSQVIAQMGVTGRKWCDFFIFSKHGSMKVRVPFDECRWQALVKACDIFFLEYMIDFLKSV